MSEHGVRIQLDRVTKQYPRQPEPAVDNVSLDIPAGELVVFVGPSGCGKTTTMKMINRLIEPTSGEITIGGENVLALEPNELRTRIGYVIQQIGLFPHMTVRDNIAVVPRLLGWDKARITRRVDELLELVGLDPSAFRDRLPKQLSGGQQQRVGVARALAADPPVMLMDEPFGATDPITRDKLQNEFLRLQKELRKTIIFVTHDFDEAVKLGDRIAVLAEQSHVAQYDTPGRILAAPANDYVEGFVGSAAAIKQLGLMHVGMLTGLAELSATSGLPTVRSRENARDALDIMLRAGTSHVVVLDEQGDPRGVIGFEDIAGLLREEVSRVGQDA
ncbi:ABC transporter ATP-binding protein [Kibdelosporangium persicum]|uniref:L-proline glycine betaine ABC transport system permease protein ProV n=1 Tax=Kibdelosporangium persicum TaxID=2698649 RepID=A0ABX2F9G6_9PSEU|nr:ABC transporter ATP-binding protein [Kibdelosporangium persicum]NRN68005.1 L-proline glycine betaine ABC transport system permease protein ProV [Kibdelosporangium persicum]